MGNNKRYIDSGDSNSSGSTAGSNSRAVATTTSGGGGGGGYSSGSSGSTNTGGSTTTGGSGATDGSGAGSSGSAGGGSGAGGGGSTSGGPTSEESCENVNFRTTVSNPNIPAIQKTSLGQPLIIKSDGSRPLVMNDNDEVCGTITKEASRLVKCIRQGYRFVAVVLVVDGGAFEVRVQNAS